MRSRNYAEVSVGEELPPLVVPLTTSLIVAGAIASRDYQDVHHDPASAKAKGSQDIFMNILTSNGLVGRYVTDWAGPDAIINRVAIRLGAPNYPGDTMTITGRVSARRDAAGTAANGAGAVDIDIVGANGLGNHVTGTVTVTLPAGTSTEVAT